MRSGTTAPKRRSRLVTFGMALLGVGLILTGALLIAMGSSEVFGVTLFGIGVMPELPGLIILASGFFVLFRGGRASVSRDAED
jgi:hypothetical protein